MNLKYQWVKLIAAPTWEELEQESKGNKYMERALEEMIKISQDEKERYLYLREEMEESDRVSQIQSAQRLGRKEGIQEGKILGKKEGEILKLIVQVQKKMKRGDTQEKIVDDLMEDKSVIKPIYQLVQENPDKTKEEIYKMLEL